MNKYFPARTAQAVKAVLASFANGLSQNYCHQSREPKEFLSHHGLYPLVKWLKSSNYQLLPKAIPKLKIE